MKKGGSSIVTAIVTAIMTPIVTATVLQPTPASADVVTVCGAPSGVFSDTDRNGPSKLASPLQRLGAEQDADVESLLALWRDEKGFDILIRWGEAGQSSLRAEGAEIIAALPTLDFVHLMVAHAGHLEHFLFSLDEQGSGELLRSADEDRLPSVSSNAICVGPK